LPIRWVYDKKADMVSIGITQFAGFMLPYETLKEIYEKVEKERGSIIVPKKEILRVS